MERKKKTHAIRLTGRIKRGIHISKNRIHNPPNNNQHPLLPHRHPHHLRARTVRNRLAQRLILPHLLLLGTHIQGHQIPRIRRRIRRHIPTSLIHRPPPLRLQPAKIIPHILRRDADSRAIPDVAVHGRRESLLREAGGEFPVFDGVVLFVGERGVGVGFGVEDEAEEEAAVGEEFEGVGEEDAVGVVGGEVVGGAGEGGDGR